MAKTAVHNPCFPLPFIAALWWLFSQVLAIIQHEIYTMKHYIENSPVKTACSNTGNIFRRYLSSIVIQVNSSTKMLSYLAFTIISPSSWALLSVVFT